MDLLCAAYGGGAASDDDDDDDRRGGGGGDRQQLGAPPLKRHRSGGFVPSHRAPPPPPPPLVAGRYVSKRERAILAAAAASSSTVSDSLAASSQAAPPLVAGRYVSKRERALLAAASFKVSDPAPSPTTTPLPSPHIASPVVGTISDSDLSADALASLQYPAKNASSNNSPTELSVSLNGHTKAVNSVHWSQSHGHLLASAGMDQTVHVWNVWNRKQPKARIFNYHKAAVKDVRWAPNGLSLLSCGFDCSSRVVDVEKGEETNIFKEDQVVEVIKFHPNDSNLFLSGGSKGLLRLWDIRRGEVVKEYQRALGAILDIEFSADGKHFISSSDTSKSSITENSIIIWDVGRQVPLSNQVYTEAYTCPCIRYHPTDASFVAQSNGNYIAIFSARPPFKLDRYKRYEGHGVWGFPTKCNFSSDGKELVSGSSDGSIYFYNYKTSRLSRKMKAFDEACIDVAYHPVRPNVIAACSWNGEVSVYE